VTITYPFTTFTPLPGLGNTINLLSKVSMRVAP
jgi:hypothetical protein